MAISLSRHYINDKTWNKNLCYDQDVKHYRSCNTLGSPIMAIPTQSFRFWPPLRCVARVDAFSVSKMSSNVLSTAASISSFGIPLIVAKTMRCSLTVSVSNKISCCGQTPVEVMKIVLELDGLNQSMVILLIKDHYIITTALNCQI